MHSGGISSLQLLAQSTIQDRKRHLSSARVTGKPEVIPTDPIRAFTSGLPTIRPEPPLCFSHQRFIDAEHHEKSAEIAHDCSRSGENLRSVLFRLSLELFKTALRLFNSLR